MGAIANTFQRKEYVDFAAVARAALGSLELIASTYLPNGKREGREWVALNPTRPDGSPGSFKFNLGNGVWSDFATGEKGGDAIDLVAYVTGKSKLDAARELADLLGVAPLAGSASITGNILPMPRKDAAPIQTLATPSEAATAPATFPARTAPDKDGKPRFIAAGEDGPRRRDDEKRRHVYRQGGVPVRIKILKKNTEARAFNVYRVTDADGTTGWQYAKPAGFRDVPFTADRYPFATDGPLYWPEGEKDVETLAAAGLAAFTFGGTGDGLPAGCESYLENRAIVILADNDAPGRKHADDKAALAAKVAAGVKVVDFAGLPEKGDVSDWLPLHSVDALQALIAESPEWSPPTQPEQEEPAATSKSDDRYRLPYGYVFRKDGLYWTNPDDEEKPPIKLSGPFDIEAMTRDADGSSWGLLLRWIDNDGREHRCALAHGSLAGDGTEARRTLMNDGLYVAPGQKARQLFNAFLLQAKTPARARATQRIGWHSNSFVLPDQSYGGSENDRLLLQTATAHEHTFRQAGTLESWQQNVARYAAGNSRLVLAISAAFAGPLIGPCSAEGGGVHFRGASSTGKSTALHVAGSIWGGGGVTGFVRSWRATSNGLEGVALAHCDTLLCLDELSQLQAREAGEAAYMLANGSGKSRSARDGSARRTASWRVMFLSSGEISLADKIAEEGRGRKLAAGQQVRIIDIPADAGAGMGLFETLHGFPSSEALARHLREATQHHYGVAAREYLTRVVPQMSELQKQASICIQGFCRKYVPAGADGQVERVAQRFGLIAAGGVAASMCGIVPWTPDEAVRAAGRCLQDWIVQRGGCEPAEERQGIEQVRAFLLANGMARFIPAWEEEDIAKNRADSNLPPIHSGPVMRDVAGYRLKVGDGWDYFITPSAWRDVCAGMDAKRVARVLTDRGFIAAADKEHLAKSMRVPNFGKQRVYHVVSTFMEGDDNA